MKTVVQVGAERLVKFDLGSCDTKPFVYTHEPSRFGLTKVNDFKPTEDRLGILDTDKTHVSTNTKV